VALEWVAQRKCGAALGRRTSDVALLELVERAEKWLRENTCENSVRRWYSGAWGEVPAGKKS
jgi:ribonuclease HI